jgi:hypothetical protein
MQVGTYTYDHCPVWPAPSHSISHSPCCWPLSWPTLKRADVKVCATSIAVRVCKVGSWHSMRLFPCAKAAQMMSCDGRTAQACCQDGCIPLCLLLLLLMRCPRVCSSKQSLSAHGVCLQHGTIHTNDTRCIQLHSSCMYGQLLGTLHTPLMAT